MATPVDKAILPAYHTPENAAANRRHFGIDRRLAPALHSSVGVHEYRVALAVPVLEQVERRTGTASATQFISLSLAHGPVASRAITIVLENGEAQKSWEQTHGSASHVP